MTESQIKMIKKADYSPDGKSPILIDLEAELETLDEHQLIQIITKCKNYEVNVQKFKVDMKYIKQLTQCIKDFYKLSELLPKTEDSIEASSTYNSNS